MKMLPRLPRNALQGPLYLLLLPVLLHYALHQYAKSSYWRDPTSPYFDTSRAYMRVYSNVRSGEADAFINASSETPFRRSGSNLPYICVGIPTVARPGSSMYFQTSLGSLLAGLTQPERDGLYIMPFIANTDKSQHPAYGAKWLDNIVDRVLEYNTSAPSFEHTKELEAESVKSGKPNDEKDLSDYTHLLRSCAATGAEYVLMMEDDVLALDGWYHRTLVAIGNVERRTRQRGVREFLYLRLFYTEGLLFWESPGLPRSLRRWWLVGTLVAAITIFYTVRRNNLMRRNVILLFIVIYASIAVYINYFFYNGHNSMLPTTTGVHEMPKLACCAQSIIYPKSRVEILARYYEKAKSGCVESLTEKLADEYPHKVGARWALTPSPMQHIGSMGDSWGTDKGGEMRETEKAWNFAFELNDANSLRKEHVREVGRLAWRMQALSRPMQMKMTGNVNGKGKVSIEESDQDVT